MSLFFNGVDEDMKTLSSKNLSMFEGRSFDRLFSSWNVDTTKRFGGECDLQRCKEDTLTSRENNGLSRENNGFVRENSISYVWCEDEECKVGARCEKCKKSLLSTLTLLDGESPYSFDKDLLYPCKKDERSHLSQGIQTHDLNNIDGHTSKDRFEVAPNQIPSYLLRTPLNNLRMFVNNLCISIISRVAKVDVQPFGRPIKDGCI
jgi:hypothetical protein